MREIKKKKEKNNNQRKITMTASPDFFALYPGKQGTCSAKVGFLASVFEKSAT